MNKDARLNAKQIAADLGFGEWIVYGVKKANRLLAAQGLEDLIFCGRYSTPGKVSKWLDDHPSFVASQTLRAKTSAPSGTPRHNFMLGHARALVWQCLSASGSPRQHRKAHARAANLARLGLAAQRQDQPRFGSVEAGLVVVGHPVTPTHGRIFPVNAKSRTAALAER